MTEYELNYKAIYTQRQLESPAKYVYSYKNHNNLLNYLRFLHNYFLKKYLSCLKKQINCVQKIVLQSASFIKR